MTTAGADDLPGPIEAATGWLAEWLAGATGALAETGTPLEPSEEDSAASLWVWPMSVVPERELRTAHRREPFRFRVRHLVAGRGPEPAATRLLDRALVAAVEAGEPSIEFTPVADETWLALGCRPRLALLIDVPAVIARPMPEVPLVREPLRTRMVPEVSAATAAFKEA